MNGTWWRLLKLARPFTNWIVLATLLGIATLVSGIGLLSTSAYLISEAALHPSIAALEVAIVGVRFFGLARGLARYGERLLTHLVTFRLLTRLRVWFYRTLEPLAPARLFSEMHNQNAGYRSGDLLNHLVSDIETLQNVYARVLAPPLIALFVGIGMWLLLGAFHPLLALVFCSLFLLSAIGIPLVTALLSQKAGQQLIQSRAALNAHMVESLQGITDILAFGQEARQAAQARDLSQAALMAQRRIARIGGLQEALGAFMLNVTAWTVLMLAIPLVRSGQINGVYLALLVLAALSSFEAVLALPAAFQHFGSSLAAGCRLFKLVDAQPAVRDPEASLPAPKQYDLHIRHLSFRYATSESCVLNDLNLDLPAGQCVALLGPSGAGKSTLAHILLRFWDYADGQILLGGQELRDYDQEEIRKLIGVIEQETHLFNTTIRQNLLLARPGASEAELVRAAQQAQIHNFILSLPRGYETEIGEEGVCLSGGERQRLSIARAILKDAPILILDEPTAHLDAANAREVISALREVMRGRTTLLITHRQSDLEGADKIVNLLNGHRVSSQEASKVSARAVVVSAM